ncbi:MAG: bifunctional homocysteine S-methyltransferase/methylenetetrahydrofolate reductase [Alicyclobacillus sp.]|nr:bifunctional homocysteine S-methyltransferase/methylenetetrahydrofolate reductase [Alicyclobacillus sp.]
MAQEIPDGPVGGARALLAERVVVADGAMATLLHQSGVPVRTCYEALSLTQPALVQGVHEAYIRAGAQVIQTNTFSGHRLGLLRYGLEGQLREVNRAAVKAARRAVSRAGAAAGKPVYVFGTIGSAQDIGGQRWVAEAGWGALREVFAEQLEALLEAGVDGLILETFASLEEMRIALEVVRAATDLPVVATLSPDAAEVTRDGVPMAQALRAMAALGADVVGLNCRLGLAGIARAYERVVPQPYLFLAAVPNAGLLHVHDGTYGYTAGADYFAEMGEQLVRQGVRWMGGCCGTTPEHIRKLAERLTAAGFLGTGASAGQAEREVSATATVRAVDVRELPRAEPAGAGADIDVVRPADVSPLLRQVRQRTTVIVELDPPRTPHLGRYLAGARALRDAGADAVTLADNSLGTVRVSNMAVAALLKPEGIEPLVHVTCRDRNLIGQQSHLMGFDVLGIHHILLVTGDPSRFGDLPGATSVYDVSSIELTRMVRRLNEGVGFSGQPLKHPSRFVIGTSFNPNVHNFDKAVERLRRKLDAGADYVMTQPVYDVRMMERIAEAADRLRVPVFIGILPLVSARNARYLHNEVPGIEVPDEILRRMTEAPAASAAQVGLELAQGLVAEARQFFHGLYLMTPFLRYDLTAQLTAFAKDEAGSPSIREHL